MSDEPLEPSAGDAMSDAMSDRPLNRQQRRALLRALPSPVSIETTPLCAAGKHALKRIEGTVKGDVVATVVMCAICRRTFQEILDEDPVYAAMYQAWMDAGQPDEWPPAAADAE